MRGGLNTFQSVFNTVLLWINDMFDLKTTPVEGDSIYEAYC